MSINKDIVDRDVKVPTKLMGDIPAGNLAHSAKHAGQYDNPRGYPGLAGLQLNRKNASRIVEHHTQHSMEESAELVRTGTPKNGSSD